MEKEIARTDIHRITLCGDDYVFDRLDHGILTVDDNKEAYALMDLLLAESRGRA